jgi:hypothetical protein
MKVNFNIGRLCLCRSDRLRVLLLVVVIAYLWLDKMTNTFIKDAGAWRFTKRPNLKQCFDLSECEHHKPIKVRFLNSLRNLNKASAHSVIFETVGYTNDTCIAIFNIYGQIDFNEVKYAHGRNKVIFIDHTSDKENRQKVRAISECSLYASYNMDQDDRNDLDLDISILSLNHLDLNSLVFSKKILFLSFERRYFLTYHEALDASAQHSDQLKQVKNSLLKDRSIAIDLACTSDEVTYKSLCFKTSQRELILLNSTFTLIVTADNEWSVENTIRLIESISVGTIPVLLDTNVKLPLGDYVAWNEIVIRIPRLDHLHPILSSLNEADIMNRRIKAYNVFKAYFSDETSQFLTLLTLVRNRLSIQAMGFEESYGNEYSLDLPDTFNETLQINMTDAVKNVFADTDEYLGKFFF